MTDVLGRDHIARWISSINSFLIQKIQHLIVELVNIDIDFFIVIISFSN